MQLNFFDDVKAWKKQQTDEEATQPCLPTHWCKTKWLSQHRNAGDSRQSQQRDAQHPHRGGRQVVPESVPFRSC